MQIISLHIKEVGHSRTILNGFEKNFPVRELDQEEARPVCMVGKNGTGKSQLLEALADIFYYLDNEYRKFQPKKGTTGMLFSLEYLIHEKNIRRHIKVDRLNPKRKNDLPIITEIIGNKELEIQEKDVESVLPSRIIGYTSGENETLSIPFLDSNTEYSEFVGDLALKKEDINYDDIPTPRLIFPNYKSNISIAVANFLLRTPEELSIFSKEELIQFGKITSFRIIIQMNHTAAPNKNKGGIQLTTELKEYLDKLLKCATSYNFQEKEKRYTIDFLVTPSTKEAFRDHFDEAFTLFTCFYKFELLNNLIIPKTERTRIKAIRKTQKFVEKLPDVSDVDKVFNISQVKLKLENIESPVDYIALSDGQHQYMHVFGLLLMIDQPNVLFLLDEPETHFNPAWRSNFVKILNTIAKNRNQEYLITTHSPFILSDSRRENVFLFKRNPKDGSVSVKHPEKETYGASIERLLKEAFDIPVPISKAALEDIDQLIKEGSLQELEDRKDEFADSMRKFYLYQKIEEEKESKKK